MEPDQINEKYESRDIDSADAGRTVNNTVRHTYRQLSENEKIDMVALKDAGAEMLRTIATVKSRYGTTTDMSAFRELDIAEQKVEEAVMWAVKHVTK